MTDDYDPPDPTPYELILELHRKVNRLQQWVIFLAIGVAAIFGMVWTGMIGQ